MGKSPNGFGNIRKKVVNGKTYYEGRYTDPILHKQKSVSASTQKECREKLMKVLSQIEQGAYVTPQKVTVAAWLDKWLSGRQMLESTSSRLYERYVRLYINPALGEVNIQDLRYIHCQDFVSLLVKNPKRTKQLSAKTVKNIVAVLCAALNAAVKAELIKSNPAASLEKPRIEKVEPKVMTVDEQDVFVAAIKESPYRNLYLIGLNLGLRISEALGLQWCNINMESGEILIDKQLGRKAGSTERALRQTKTHKGRTIFAPQFVIAALQDERARQNRNKLRVGKYWDNPDGLVFTREDGSPLPHNSVAKDFKRIATRIGRPDLTFHSLRHTYITDELRLGTDLKTVSDNAGHSTIAITADVYAASTKDMKKAAAERRQLAHDAAKKII